jgi:hypothetical protein
MDTNQPLQHIIKAFTHTDRYAAHKEASKHLIELAKDSQFLFSIVKQNLSNPEYLKRVRHYPTLSMDIFQNENFQLVANIWLPLPDKNTDLSFQSIHHHGNLLLSTVSAFGPGYDSIVFKPNFSIDPITEVTTMEIEKIYHNDLHRLEFVDHYTPHVVFYPTALSVTYALWSTDKVSLKEKYKNNELIQMFKKPLRRFLEATGLNKKVGVNTVNYFDFYIENNQVKALKNRLGYEKSTNENFIQNIFYFIQSIGFNDDAFIQSLLLREGTNPQTIDYINKFLNKEPIKDKFVDAHLFVPKVSLVKQDILSAIK